MTWFKVDDGLAFHAKVVQAGNPAMGLWVRAGSWCAQQLTDGFVPDHIVTTLGTRTQAKALADARLWVRQDGGYQFHGWNEEGRQPTRQAVEKERSEARDRMKKARDAKRGSGDVRANTDRTSGEVRVTRPDPSRPVPTRASSKTSQGGVTEVDARPSTPPLFPDHCDEHANDPRPDKCGGCADARKARRVLSVVSLANPATVPHCGECDETRHRETPFGVIRCPECHPRAEEAS